MKVSGFVTISLRLNVYDLETDAVYINKYGDVMVSDGDQFFLDWSEGWEQGIGELLGTSVEYEGLEAKDTEDEEDDEDEEED